MRHSQLLLHPTSRHAAHFCVPLEACLKGGPGTRGDPPTSEMWPRGLGCPAAHGQHWTLLGPALNIPAASTGHCWGFPQGCGCWWRAGSSARQRQKILIILLRNTPRGPVHRPPGRPGNQYPRDAGIPGVPVTRPLQPRPRPESGPTGCPGSGPTGPHGCPVTRPTGVRSAPGVAGGPGPAPGG